MSKGVLSLDEEQEKIGRILLIPALEKPQLFKEELQELFEASPSCQWGDFLPNPPLSSEEEAALMKQAQHLVNLKTEWVSHPDFKKAFLERLLNLLKRKEAYRAHEAPNYCLGGYYLFQSPENKADIVVHSTPFRQAVLRYINSLKKRSYLPQGHSFLTTFDCNPDAEFHGNYGFERGRKPQKLKEILNEVAEEIWKGIQAGKTPSTLLATWARYCHETIVQLSRGTYLLRNQGEGRFQQALLPDSPAWKMLLGRVAQLQGRAYAVYKMDKEQEHFVRLMEIAGHFVFPLLFEQLLELKNAENVEHFIQALRLNDADGEERCRSLTEKLEPYWQIASQGQGAETRESIFGHLTHEDPTFTEDVVGLLKLKGADSTEHLGNLIKQLEPYWWERYPQEREKLVTRLNRLFPRLFANERTFPRDINFILRYQHEYVDRLEAFEAQLRSEPLLPPTEEDVKKSDFPERDKIFRVGEDLMGGELQEGQVVDQGAARCTER
ncbi:MAG: hypothetical protein V1746_00685 [bacterium]